jgi:peptidoglycan/LPS O-acetylase OafA/YrhL
MAKLSLSSLKELPFQSGTVSEVFNPRANALTIVRWGLALLVVVSHSFPLGGFHGGIDPLSYHVSGQGEDFGSLAVAGFFVLSGFLITRSYQSSKNVGQYLWKRAIRILPAFWLSLFIVAFVLAPIAWVHEHHHLAGYFASGPQSAWHYVQVNFFLTMHQWNIQGLLSATPYGHSSSAVAWDGSLWTLIFEAKCYVLLGVVGMCGLLRYRWTVLALTAMFYVLYVINASAKYLGVTNPLATAQALPGVPYQESKLFFLFFLGSCFVLFRDSLLLDDKWGIAAGLGALVCLTQGGWAPLGLALFAYFLIWFVSRVNFSKFERFGDPSYGTYVFAFPIQMMLAEYGFSHLGGLRGTLGYCEFAGVSVVLSGLAGYVSWHLVERHALKLKNGFSRADRAKTHVTGEVDSPAGS